MLSKLYKAFRQNVYVDKTINILKKFSLVAFAFLSISIYFLIETFSRHSIINTFLYMTKSPIVYLYNTFIIYTTYMIVYIFKRRRFAITVISAFWLLMGSINGVILAFRVTPFTGTDLTLISNAISLSGAYLSVEQIALIAAGLIFTVACIIYGWFKFKKHKGEIKYKRNAVLIILCWAMLFLVTKVNVNLRILSTYFGNIAFAYQDYGFPYCFSMSVFATGIDCPNEYSKELIDEIKDDLSKAGENDTVMPNIIFLQLESFFDPELVKYLSFSEDPIPNFRQLEKDYSSGYLTVPSVGAGTANTEFEIMTGMSLRYFGPGEYPYKTILKDTPCESVAYNLKELGYGTHAIHNNEADFYDRKTVFANLGYDTFTSEEYMNVEEYTPMGWAKDICLIEQITDVLESTKERDYIYTISVQGHGGYPDEPINMQQRIEVYGAKSEGEKNSYEYYVNQINEMDSFIKALTDELSSYKEPTVLVMYGDHLPTLGIEDSSLVNSSVFETEYVIWDNMGIERERKNVKAYQLSAHVLGKVGIHSGTLTGFHQVRRKTSNYMADLDALQYDMLYGEQFIYNGELPFKTVDLQMGVKSINISKVLYEDGGSIYVKGSNFTKASKAYINDEEYDTLFIDENTLKVKNTDVKQGDVIKVSQFNNTYGILSTTNIYIMEK